MDENTKKVIDYYNKPNKSFGISFVIETDGVDLHHRDSQPCYGELRKYEKTHGEDATKPEKRPGDLHHPFPDGKPTRLFLLIHKSKVVDNWFELVVNGPWRSGFGEWTAHTLSKNNQSSLMEICNCRIDPTVLVNAMKLRTDSILNSSHNEVIKDLTFDSELEKKFFSFLHSLITTRSNRYYYVSPNFCMEKFLNCTPNNLSGGTLEDREDYDRKNLAQIFRSDLSPSENPANQFKKSLIKNHIDDYYKMFKELWVSSPLNTTQELEFKKEA